MAIIQEKQSLFDIAAQNFGTLDNLVKLSDDNTLSISESLVVGSEITINNTNLGEADIKQEINDNNYTFNNEFVEPEVIYEGLIYTDVLNNSEVLANETYILANA